ncbi:hypothetical protein CBS101457_002057 [Exobasidium rhododendri]|nr:hypothetical protein CBS101457_002057 [Exobasidium rhododendri]
MSSLSIFVVGGNGRVAREFTRLASQAGHTVISQIRNTAQSSELPSPGPGKVEPLVQDLEDLSAEEISLLFRKYDPSVILFAAGAGGKGGEERTFKVDRDGAIKVFDAIEKSEIANTSSNFTRFLLVSAVDVRDVQKTKPDWYGEADFKTSERMRKALPAYMQAKYEADLNLSQRTTFPWTVLRPSTLQDEAQGKVDLARKQTISNGVPRQSVAMTLLKLAELPKSTQGVNGRMWDLTKGSGEIQTEVKEAAGRGTTDWVG